MMNTSLPTDPTKKKAVGLREISSLDTSQLFPSLEEKKNALKEKKTLQIPNYTKSIPYVNTPLKRMLSKANYLRALLQQKMSGKDYPLIVVLVVNNKCNWNCTYCFGDYPNRKEIDYSTDEVKFLVDELYAMGVRYINMHGGETLLRPDIGELCHFIKQKGMYLSLITNGSLLPRKLNEILAVDNITISLDGNKTGNDLNRGPGTFEKTLQAIDLVKNAKIPLCVQATLTKHTMNDVGFLSELAKEKNFHLQFSILFKPLPQATAAQMSPEEIRQTLLEVLKFKKKKYPVFTSERALRAAYEWPVDFNETHHLNESDIPKEYLPHRVQCYYSRTKFTVEADGYVYPCFLTTDGSFSPLNWKEVGVKKAIDHVHRKNLCRACPAMTQNDHNLLLGMNVKQIAYLLKKHLSRQSF